VEVKDRDISTLVEEAYWERERRKLPVRVPRSLTFLREGFKRWRIKGRRTEEEPGGEEGKGKEGGEKITRVNIGGVKSRSKSQEGGWNLVVGRKKKAVGNL